MSGKDDNRPQITEGMFAHLDELHLVGIEKSIAKGEYVSAEDLAAALRKHGSRPISHSVLDYLCRHLEGKIPKPKGRKALPPLEKRQVRTFLRYLYRRNLTWLQGRKARYGHLDGWPGIHGASWWHGPPNERAARMVAQRVGHGAEAWRAIQNEVSSQE